jgi:hypothetical protein
VENLVRGTGSISVGKPEGFIVSLIQSCWYHNALCLIKLVQLSSSMVDR